MNIDLIVVGKIKENYLSLGINEYKKRLQKYINLNIIEVPDEKIPLNSSSKEEEIVREKEGKSILKNIKCKSFIIPLDINGKNLNSLEFSNFIEEKFINTNYKNLVFIIGGSLGLSKEVLSLANFKLSFSKMTFPHQLMRLIFLEQLYRSFKIMKNENYHK